MKEPRLRPETRDQRLRDIKKKKEGTLEDLEGEREHLGTREELVRTDRVRELLGSDPHEINRLRNYQEALDGLLNLCDRVQQAESPQEEVQRMQEALVQKDDEWVRDDSGNDLRLVFFQLYFQIKQVKFETRGIHGTAEDVLTNLRSRRFNKDFLEDVTTSLEQIRARIRQFREDTEQHIRDSSESSARFEESLAREAARVPKAKERIERRIAITKKNITRLSDLIQQSSSETTNNN